MPYLLIILWVCTILLTIYIVQLYNSLVLLKHNIDRAWANIEVLLKQRNSELAKLIAVCQQHIKYEANILQQVINARTLAIQACDQANVPQIGDAETTLRQNVKQLFVIAEQYPELKAIESFKNLGKQITLLETHIADRRELYNASVNLNNIRIEQFPNLILAYLFNFKKANVLTFSEDNII